MRRTLLSTLLQLSISSTLICSSLAVCLPRGSPSTHNRISQPPSPSPSPSPSSILIPKPTTNPPPSFSVSQAVVDSGSSIAEKVSDAFNSLKDDSVGPHNSFQALCNKADYPDSCIASITSVSAISTLSSGTVDPKSTLRTLIKGAAIATQQALTAGRSLAKQPGHDKVTKSVIDSCVGGFEDAIHDLEASGTALDGNDKGTCMINLSAVMDDYESCSDAFTDNAQPVHPMQTYEDLLHQHASNCLAIGSLIR